MNEIRAPAIPTTMRITPTVLMSTPFTSAVTAHVRIAPTAMRMRLALRPIRLPPAPVASLREAAFNSALRYPVGRRRNARRVQHAGLEPLREPVSTGRDVVRHASE